MPRCARLVLPVAILALAGLTSPAGSSQPQFAPAHGLDEAIRAKVGLTAYTLQSLNMPAEPGQVAEFSVQLGDRKVIADLNLEPVDAPGCTMIILDGVNPPQEVPAPPPCTYRGTVRGEPGSMVSGSIIQGRFTGIVVLPDGAWNILPLEEVRNGSDPAAHIVSRFEDSIQGNWRCGVKDDEVAPPAFVPSEPVQMGGHQDLPYLCEVAADADYQFFQQVAGTASAVAQDISTVVLNASSYSILSGTNLRFRVVRYVIRTTPAANPGLYATTDPTAALQGVRQVWANLGNSIPRDTVHLFTGRDLSGITIGIAYLGTVCSSTFAYGLSQSRFTLQPGRRAAVTAHEIGHNLNCNHCDQAGHLCSPCYLMSAAQGNTTDQLTRYGCSTSIITGFIPSRGCIAPGDSGSPLMAGPCAADFDRNGVLDARDLAAFSAAFSKRDPRGDVDTSGALTVNDAVAFMKAYASGCR